MRKAVPFIIAAIVLGCPLAHAQPKAPQRSTVVGSEPGKAVAVSVAEVTAMVVAINTATRTVTLKGADGHLVEVFCSDEVKNFAQISVGDNVTVSYQEALTLELKKARAPLASSGTTSEVRAEPGARPGGMVGREITVLADVVAVDPKKSTITLKGPAGNVVELKVRNPDHFKVVKKGDQVEVVYSEALAIAVTPAPKPDAKKN
jgi:hypothetical protein